MTALARLQSLDTIRGVAVMGILLLNIVAFSMPDAAYMNPRAYGGSQGADLGVYLVNLVLFDGRIRGLFSFLFGASMLLVIERAEASGRSPAKTHYARMIWLLAFGLAHLWLVWHGDILAHYALVGMIAFAMRKMRVSRLVILGVILALVGCLIFSGLPFAVYQLLHAPASAAGAAERAAQLKEFTNGFGIPSSADIASKLTLMRGDYGPIMIDRFKHNLFSPLITLALFGPETLAYMLFGMAGLKSGMLRGEWSARRYVKWLVICWAIALPAYVAIASYLVREQFEMLPVVVAMAAQAPVRPFMYIGWACLIMLLARGGGALQQRIAAAGRMAFTNYLTTSLICTTLFYGYGFGLFGHLSRWQLYPVVFGVWALMLLWSKPWLDHFRFGPFEWLWRSLARGRLEPIRGAAPA